MRISFYHFSQIGQLVLTSFSFNFSDFYTITCWFLFSTTRQQCCFAMNTVRKATSFLNKKFCCYLIYMETSLIKD